MGQLFLTHRASRLGQSVTEHAVIGAVILAALIGMQTYLRRGVQARIKTSTDNLLAISDEDATNPDPTKRGEQTQRFGATSSQKAVDASGEISNFTSTFDSTVQEEVASSNGVLTARRFSEGPEVSIRNGLQRTRQFESPRGPETPPVPDNPGGGS